MRTEVRLCFDVSEVPEGPRAFLDLARCGSDVAKVDDVPVLGVLDAWVTLEESDPRLPLLEGLLERRQMTWLEWHEDRFTEEEKEAARLLLVRPNRGCEVDGGAEWGTTFDLTGACPACATGCHQTSALFIKGEDVPNLEGHHVAQTYFWHILIDEGLAAALEDAAVTGLLLRSVYAVMPDGRQVKLRWRQLDAEKMLPRMSPRTSGLRRIVQSPKLRPCEVCGRNGNVYDRAAPTRIVYRASDLEGALDVNRTWENYWSAFIDREDFRQSVLSRPWTIVTPKVHRIFRDAGVTEVDFHPIRVEDG
jgi:hypothetical protein